MFGLCIERPRRPRDPDRTRSGPAHDLDSPLSGGERAHGGSSDQVRAARVRETYRRDAWWVEPLVVFLVLGGFLVYATWAAFQNAHYTYGPYLSPFYSPVLWGDSHHAWFGPKPAWWPALLPFSPALLILPFPGLFRFTCYYYRGAYYKAFWSDPIACSVGEPRGTRYRGERWFPLVLQNVHRYFAYVAVLFLFVLSYDVWLAMWFANPATGQKEFGIGLGTVILAVNVVLLALLHARLPLDPPHRAAAARTRCPSRRSGRLLRLLERAQQPAQLFAW